MKMFTETLQRKRSTQLAPAMPTQGIWGNKAAFESDPLQFLLDAHKQYGDIVRIRLGPFSFHILSDPKESYAILVDREKHYSKRTAGYQFLSRALGQGLVTSEGTLWRKQRRVAQPAFRRSAIGDLAARMSEAAQDKVAGWRDNQRIGLAQEMTSLTLRIAGETLFDIDISNKSSELSCYVNELQDFFQKAITSPLVALFPKAPLPANLHFNRCISSLDRIIFQIIEQRRKSPSSKATLLQLFMDARDDDGYSMSDRQLRDEVITMLLAGHETTANTLVWTQYLLAKHPKIADKVSLELDMVLAGSAPTHENIAQLTYLAQVLKESLRLYPPAWSMGRRAEQEDKILGKTIPKGTIVLLSPYVIHRQPGIWPSPNDFDPDRFAAEKGSPAKGTYWPFLIGPRKCIGEHFAMTEALIVLATVLSKFKLNLVNDIEVSCDPSVTLRPKSEIYVKLSKREPA